MFVARHKIEIPGGLEFLIVQERECDVYDLVIVDPEHSDKEGRINLAIKKLDQHIVDTSYEFYSNWKNANASDEKFLDKKLQILLKIHDYLRQQQTKERDVAKYSRITSLNYFLIQNQLIEEIVELFHTETTVEDGPLHESFTNEETESDTE